MRRIAAAVRVREEVRRGDQGRPAEGIRPMPVGRLLAYLGYEMGTPIVGRAEAVNPPRQ